MGKWMLAGALAGLFLPFGTTLIVTGNIHGMEYNRQQERMAAGNYRILLDRSGGSENGKWLSLEEYLPSVLAVQISPDSEMEAIKVQAVIARTYIRQQMEKMGDRSELAEESLNEVETFVDSTTKTEAQRSGRYQK